MTDDQMHDLLDRRGRAAAAGMNAEVAGRPVPAFEPDAVRIAIARPSPDRRRRRWITVAAAAAAAVLVFAGAVSLMARATGDDDSAPADRVDTGTTGRYVLDQPPDGLGLVGVLDGPPGQGGVAVLLGPAVEATVYGPEEGDATLAVAVLPAGDGDGHSDDCVMHYFDRCESDLWHGDTPPQASNEGLDEIDIAGGRRAWDASGPTAESMLVVVDGKVVAVYGRDRDAVDAVARAVVVDGPRASVPVDGLTAGVSEIGTADLGDVLGRSTRSPFTTGSFTASARWSVWYAPAGEDYPSRGVAVTVQAGGVLEVGLLGAVAVEREALTVRSHGAVLVRFDSGEPSEPPQWSVRWEERPGEVVDVVGVGIDREELLALAEGIRPVADDEVDDLRRQPIESGLDAPGVTVVGRGQLSDGSTWILAHGIDSDAPGELRVRTGTEVRSGRPSYFASQEAQGPNGEVVVTADPLGGTVFLGETGTLAWAFGRTSAEVAMVEVRTADGAVVGSSPSYGTDDVTGWFVEVPDDVAAEGGLFELVVVALDAGGAEIDRLGG